MCLLAQFLCTTALQYKVISNKYIYACSLSTSVILLPPIPPPVAGRLINYRFPRLAWLPTFLLRTSLLFLSHMARIHLVYPYSDCAFLLGLAAHLSSSDIPTLHLSHGSHPSRRSLLRFRFLTSVTSRIPPYP